MKKLTAIWVILFLVSACTNSKKEVVENNGDEKSVSQIQQLVMAKEKKALDQYAEGRASGYLKNVDDDVTYMEDMRADNRIDGITELQLYAKKLDSAGVIPKHRYEMVDPKVQVYGDIAIMTLQYHPFTLDGKPGRKWKATSVYAFKDDDWKLVHGHWSLIKSE